MKVRRWLRRLVDAVPRGKRWRVLGRRLSGVVLLGAGLVLMILPGPGIPLVVAGLVLLEWDATWLRAVASVCLERLAAVGPPSMAAALAEAVLHRCASWLALESARRATAR